MALPSAPSSAGASVPCPPASGRAAASARRLASADTRGLGASLGLLSVLVLLCTAPAAAQVCTAGTYSGSNGCVACPESAPFSLGGAFSAAQCRSFAFAAPTDTVFSLYGTAAEVTAGYIVTGGGGGGLSFVGDAFGTSSAALTLTPAASLTTAATQPTLPSGNAARTSAVWVKTTDCSIQLVYIWGSTANAQAWAQLIRGNSATPGSSYLWGYSNDWDTRTSVCDGRWHHVAFTYDGLGAPIGYVDGVPKPGGLVHQGAYGVGAFSTPANVAFTVSGSAGSISGYGTFSGSLFDIRVYARVLSSSEVEALSQPPLPHTRVCAAGFFGSSAVLVKNSTDNSWAWVGGVSAPNCTACPAGTYSYGGAAAACSPCASGASFLSSSLGCAPRNAPNDTAFYLSGSAAEGVAGLALTGAAPTFSADRMGAAAGALTLANGSYLGVLGANAPMALPANGSVAWSAAAWVKCAAPATWAGVLEWGAEGDAQGAASTQAIVRCWRAEKWHRHDARGQRQRNVCRWNGHGCELFRAAWSCCSCLKRCANLLAGRCRCAGRVRAPVAHALATVPFV